MDAYRKIAILTLCLLLILGLSLTGCAVTTTITAPNDEIYVVQSKSDALVELHRGDDKILVDNRGRPSFLEVFFSTLIMRSPDVQIHSGDDND